MDELTPAFEAWRVLRLGDREVVDAIVAPEHRGPSPALAAGLDRWPGAHYWLDRSRRQLVLIRPLRAAPRERWLLHATLFLLSVVCTLGAGAALQGTWFPRPEAAVAGARWHIAAPVAEALIGGAYFFGDLLHGGWQAIAGGWSFAVPLLLILLVHELGHYFAARRYAIDTSPPFFLPVPPNLSPIGSLGAFLRLRSPVLDRRQLLDVGAAGPLAGFVVALGFLLWGYATSTPTAAAEITGGFVVFTGITIPLGDSLLTRAAQELFHPGAPALHLTLTAFAGWVGVFITGLNLLPLSQLDGGHVLYGLLGRRQAFVGAVAVVGLVALAQLSWSWYLWVVLALFLGGGRIRHPAVVMPERPVVGWRRAMGWACVAVFVGTFVPVPFRV